jgi:hypothetical protein
MQRVYQLAFFPFRLAQILDGLFETPAEEERSLHRSESEESMTSALSSFANTGYDLVG